MVYDEHMHDIYYSIVTDTRDSLYVSLLMADQILETTVDVKMLGNVLTKPQKFKVEVVGERTDAKEGIHYEKLPEFYEFPAGEFIYKMPVRLIKGDAAIKQKPVTLTLRLVATGDLGVAYADKSEIRLLIADYAFFLKKTSFSACLLLEQVLLYSLRDAEKTFLNSERKGFQSEKSFLRNRMSFFMSKKSHPVF